MRVMVIVKATKNSEAGIMPGEKLLTEMGKFNDELVKAGVMLAGEGLHPSRKGKRVRLAQGTRTVIDGPFSETKELIAGYAIIQAKSREEAIEWTRRFVTVDAPGRYRRESDCEIRQILEPEEFPVLAAETLDGGRRAEQRLRDGAGR